MRVILSCDLFLQMLVGESTVNATATLKVRMISYTNPTERRWDGKCCDSFCNNCDLIFRFGLDYGDRYLTIVCCVWLLKWRLHYAATGWANRLAQVGGSVYTMQHVVPTGCTKVRTLDSRLKNPLGKITYRYLLLAICTIWCEFDVSIIRTFIRHKDRQ